MSAPRIAIVGTGANGASIGADLALAGEDAEIVGRERTIGDWRKGRHSEVDDINGHVVRTLEGLGWAAPVNGAVVELAHAIERGDLHPNPSNLGLLLERAGVASTLRA